MDVTLDEILRLIEKGYTDIESIKRYTGLGMGHCQGRMCIPILMDILREMGYKDVKLMTQRPPILPTKLKYFAEVSE